MPHTTMLFIIMPKDGDLQCLCRAYNCVMNDPRGRRACENMFTSNAGSICSLSSQPAKNLCSSLKTFSHIDYNEGVRSAFSYVIT